MDVKVALLVLLALISAVTAFPYDLLAEAAATDLDCNNNVIYLARIGKRYYELQGCTTKRGELCVDGLPRTRCSFFMFPFPCYLFYWYSGTFCWSTIICKKFFLSGHCYKMGSIPNCKDVRVQQEPTDEPVNGVQICKYVDGEKQCRTLSEGSNAEAMQEPDCFCVKDIFKNSKACMPDNCDAGRRVPPMQELITQQQQTN